MCKSAAGGKNKKKKKLIFQCRTAFQSTGDEMHKGDLTVVGNNVVVL